MNSTTIVAVFVALGMIASLPAGAQEAEPTPAPSPSGGDHTPADQNGGRCVSQEIKSLRTRDSKTIQNPNCSYTATFEQYTHYEAEPGRWEDVDLRFHEQGPDWITDNHDVIVKVAGATVTAIDRLTGQGIRWVTPGEPTVSGRKATFSHQGLEWSYFTTKPGLKLVAKVSAPRGAQTYSFPYALVGGSPDFTVDADGNLRSGNVMVPRAGAFGADGKTYNADGWRLLPGNRVAFDFDDTSLPAPAFPYDLDPTTTFEATSSPDTGGTVTRFTSYPPACESSYTTPVCCSGAQIAVERTRWTDDLCPNCYRLSNGLARWNTSALPDTATINTAVIEVGSTGETGNHDVRNLTADWYTSWPIDCADHTATAQTSALTGIPLKTLVQDYGADGYATIPLDNTTGVSRSGSTGIRFHVSGGQFSSYESNKFTFHGYGSTDRTAPRLIVRYDNAAPNISSVSDSPDPVVPGSSVTFTVGWFDANGDSVKPVICKTNSISAGSCPGGTWAVGALRSSSPSTATYTTTTADVGTRTYYAFACDALGACSPALSGNFTVNTPPSISSAADSPDPVDAGSPVTFSVGWSDADQGELVRAVICKTNAVSSGTCPGGSWVTGSLTSTSPSAATYTTSSADVGTKSYYAFACDQRNSCSNFIAGTFHVLNRPPVINLNVTPTSGDRSTTFTASLDGTYDPNNDPISYRIEWGDGTFNASQTAGHRYKNAGTYTVTGRACDSFGACSTATQIVTVIFSNEPPTANLMVSPTKGDTQTSFFASVSGSDPESDPLTFSIEWGDGTTSNSQSGHHRYEAPGTYTIIGTATDEWGESASDTERVVVCAVYQNGQCVETPPRDDPPAIRPPQQVAGPVAGVVQRAPDAARLVRSATNNVMVLDANVLQAYAENNPEYTPRCTSTAHKTCNAPLRVTHFADRVEALVRKPASPTGDGMGGVVPDVILLQEVLEEQAVRIAAKLSGRLDNNALNSTYVIAQARASAHVTNESGEIAYCTETYPPPAPQTVRDQCVRDIQTKGDSAIIYNSATVALVEGSKQFVDSQYDPNERCTVPPAAPPGGYDRDQDNQGDCAFAKWKRQYLAGFAEIKPTGKGFTGYRVAVASAHFITASHFDNTVAEPVPNESNGTHERKKIEWSNEMADRLLGVMPAPDSFVFGGDLNIHKCANKAPKQEGDHPSGSACARRGWWEGLTASDQTVAGKGYVDAIFQRHDEPGPEERILAQYQDGLDDQLNPAFRFKRIDFIFTRSALVEGTSFDLTCGAARIETDVDRNCRDFRNDDYYSDHRIVWTLLSDG